MLYPKTKEVFYNEVQQLNRDMSIAVRPFRPTFPRSNAHRREVSRCTAARCIAATHQSEKPLLFSSSASGVYNSFGPQPLRHLPIRFLRTGALLPIRTRVPVSHLHQRG
jgi:hypothetical protein